MKSIVLILVMLINGFSFLTSGSTANGKPKAAEYETGSKIPGESSSQIINAFDSVFFDLSLATLVGNSVEFPVYLRSDDVINALDFAFRYDHTKLEYDTILNMTNYIDALSFYNSLDSTVRLTSYSFSQPYSNDSLLFTVKFTILSGQICTGDLNTVSALLNGDACSYKVVECLNSGLYENENLLNASFYPNPSSNYLELVFENLTDIEIADVTGKKVFIMNNVENETGLRIDISFLNAGIYFVRFINENTFKTGKLIVE